MLVSGGNQAPVVAAGPDQTITMPQTATLNAAVGDDGLPLGGSLALSWTKVTGPGAVAFSNPGAASTVVTFSAPGVYVLQLTATDGQYTGASRLTVTVNSDVSGAYTLKLALAAAGPGIVGTGQILRATFTDANNAAVPNALVHFAVTGVNPATGDVLTDSFGVASFTLAGQQPGTDSAQATAAGLSSNTVAVQWITPRLSS